VPIEDTVRGPIGVAQGRAGEEDLGLPELEGCALVREAQGSYMMKEW